VEEVTPTANYDNGFLEIQIPKKKRQSKEIVVKVQSNSTTNTEAQVISSKHQIEAEVEPKEVEDE